MVTVSELRQFEQICIDRKWAKPNELDRWLEMHRIAIVRDNYFVCTQPQVATAVKHVQDMLFISSSNGEQAATLVLMWATGFTRFSYELEKMFIDNMRVVMREKYNIEMPYWFNIFNGMN